jgi:hypothetical protein
MSRDILMLSGWLALSAEYLGSSLITQRALRNSNASKIAGLIPAVYFISMLSVGYSR